MTPALDGVVPLPRSDEPVLADPTTALAVHADLNVLANIEKSGAVWWPVTLGPGSSTRSGSPAIR